MESRGGGGGGKEGVREEVCLLVVLSDFCCDCGCMVGKGGCGWVVG